MNKKLPHVFHNKIDKKINNNTEYYYSKNKDHTNIETEPSKNIRKAITEIFSSPNYIYKANVIITLKDKTVEKRIIGRNKNYLITMDNETIPIDSIIDIKRK